MTARFIDSPCNRPESLRTWIAQNAGIPSNQQILMTAKGKNVKQQHLVVQAEIFVYDKKYLSGETVEPSTNATRPNIPNTREPPSTLENENSIAAWQELFRSRRSWALEVVELVKNAVESIEDEVEACEIVDRSIQVALENLRNHVGNLQQSFEETKKWAEDTLQGQFETIRDWETSARTLAELPIRDEIGRLLQGPKPTKAGKGEPIGTMHNLIDESSLHEAASIAESASEEFRNHLNGLAFAMDHLKTDSDDVYNLASSEWPNLDSNSLLPEAETIAKKVSTDYEEVLRASTDAKSLARVSRLAAVHTSNLLPGLVEISDECRQMFNDAVGHRQVLLQECFSALRRVSGIQSRLGALSAKVHDLGMSEVGQSSMDALSRIFHLPTAYGYMLIEAIRRSEWSEKMRTDLQSLKDDISQQKDDEVRRRKKWMATMKGLLSEEVHSDENLLDLNFSTPANAWPFVTRDEIFSYVDDLRALGIDEAVQEITQALRGLDGPSKSRKPKSRTFKNGSVHDLGQGSILAHNEDYRSLQDENTRLEDKLRASDSRIRKLEDLLHRQSQLARAPSGTFVPGLDFERQPPSPGPGTPRPGDVLSRRSSASARRLSNQAPDEKAMVQRIVSLEAQITKLQQEAHAERRSSTESRDKMQEAESVKQDLMANFEAQRQEFDDERQRLEDDNHELKVRLEEIDEELDRVLGSRDHERMTQEQVNTNLKTELEKLRRTWGKELDQLRQNKEDLQQDVTHHRERASHAERSLHQTRDEKSSLQSKNVELAGRLRTMEDLQSELVASLQSVHSNLSPSGSAPEDLRRLVNALEVVSEGASIHARGLDDALQLATAENKSNEGVIGKHEAQIERLNFTLEELRRAKSESEETLRQERSKLSVVRSELSDEQAELRSLRTKFAAGETGSDTLRSRLVEEERRVAELLELKGESEAQIEGLKKEVENNSKIKQDVEGKEQFLRLWLGARKSKAKDLSERLFQQNDRMVGMLENFGYSVTRQDDGLLVQRASKANASTLLTMEDGTPMKRTVSGSVPIQHYTDETDLNTLYWLSDDEPTAEDTNYDAFLTALSRLDLDATVELITKRYKDVETLAKKYQKDSRSYRDKIHKLQSDAHDKIAYRGFKEGDLALFLPTRNQATRPWAAFNVGAPHYFLREQDAHKLQSRDWLLARISKVEERVVDLSRTFAGNGARDRASVKAEASDAASTRSIDDENPFELSDGLRWYLIDASEEKPGAPSTPGLGKSTVAASVVEVKGHMGRKSVGGKDGSIAANSAVNAAKTLHKSLDSRRSSEASRKSAGVPSLKPSGSSGNVNPNAPAPLAPVMGTGNQGEAEGQISSAPAGPSGSGLVKPTEADIKAKSSGQAREDAKIFEVVRQDLMLGP